MSVRLRLPETLHGWLASRSKQADRTLNAEILQILKIAQSAGTSGKG